MKSKRIMERLEKRKKIREIKKQHQGQRYDEKLGKWIERPLPIRKYNDRKIDRLISRQKKGA